MGQEKSKKRKLHHLSRNAHLLSSPPPWPQSRQSNTRVGESQPENRHLSRSRFPSLADGPFVRSNGPSLSSNETDRRVSSSHQAQVVEDPDRTITPDHRPFDSVKEKHVSREHESGGTPGSLRHRDRQFKPTIITPPTDPGSTCLEAVTAQNRRKALSHATFSATAAKEAQVEDENLQHRENSIESSTTEHYDNAVERNAGTIAEIDTASESSTEEDSDTDTEDRNATKVNSRAIKQENFSGSSTESSGNDGQSDGESTDTNVQDSKRRSAIRQRSMLEEAARHKKVETKKQWKEAANRAIATLGKPPPSRQSTFRILNRTDVLALSSLKTIIPSHILARARQSLSTNSSNSHYTADRHQTPSASEPSRTVSDLTATLVAARNLILQLSTSRFGESKHSQPTAVPGPEACRSPNHRDNTRNPSARADETQIRDELIRIARDREQKIDLLTMEVEALRQSTS